ncbi:hypothetical protein [Streptomyces europaeiscabiei]|nr:hypothetical protein OHB30_28545 [Streptomyces europaeiscabiei]
MTDNHAQAGSGPRHLAFRIHLATMIVTPVVLFALVMLSAAR